MRNCTEVSEDDAQFEFDMAAQGCGTVGVLPEGRQCVGARSGSGDSGSALSLLDCNTPMTNSLYFCLPRSALVQMRAAALLSGPSTHKSKEPDAADSKMVQAGTTGEGAKFLKLRAQPEKCVGVAYDQTGATAKGDALQLWDCGECQDHFIVPHDGEAGPIRWAEHPNFCLDSPEDPTDPTVLQLWLCNVTPAEHKHFTPRLGADGTLRQSHRNHSCIGVPEGSLSTGNVKNGVHLIMRTCNSTDEGFHFLLGEVQTTTRPSSWESQNDGVASGVFAVGSEAREEVETSANTTFTTWVTLICLACSVALFFFLCCLACSSMR